jgi:hypothetical protein
MTGTDSSANAFPHYIGDDVYPGLSKREYFAGVALQGLIAADEAWVLEPSERAIRTCSERAVMYADALLAALRKL